MKLFLVSFVVILLSFACHNPEQTNIEDENNNIQDSTLDANLLLDVRMPGVIYNFNPENHELLFYAIKTYCKSWDLPLVDVNYLPRELKPILVGNDTLVFISKQMFSDNWFDYGVLLIKPNETPIYFDIASMSNLFDVAAADDYYGFSQLVFERKKYKRTPEEYLDDFKNRKYEVDDYYGFQRILEDMDNRFVDYSEYTNMTNKEFIVSYLSLKYYLEMKENDMIAYAIIHYPFHFYSGESLRVINKPETLLRDWNSIFPQSLLDIIDDAKYFSLQVENGKIYIGDGNVCFSKISDNVKITEIRF
jgi:hypothetical protein